MSKILKDLGFLLFGLLFIAFCVAILVGDIYEKIETHEHPGIEAKAIIEYETYLCERNNWEGYSVSCNPSQEKGDKHD